MFYVVRGNALDIIGRVERRQKFAYADGIPVDGRVAPATCQSGRDAAVNGYPIRVCELLATLDAPYYIERVSTHDVKHVLAAKKAIKKALQFQKEGKGYSFVEVLVSCPTNWHMTPVGALEFMKEQTSRTFPLGVYRDKSKEEA